MPGRKPDKRELARMKAMSDLGVSPTAIATRMNRSHNTVLKYLRSEVFTDPDIGKIVEKIKEKEVQDLYLLGGKARARLHELLDEGNTKVIETVALMDRSFQQRRLLEGNSTANVGLLVDIVERIHKRRSEPSTDPDEASGATGGQEEGKAENGETEGPEEGKKQVADGL